MNAGVELEFIKSYSIWIAISAKHQMQKVFIAESANQPKTRSRRKTKSGQNTDNFSSAVRCSGFAKYMLQQVEYGIWSSDYNMHNFNSFETLKMMVAFKEKDWVSMLFFQMFAKSFWPGCSLHFIIMVFSFHSVNLKVMLVDSSTIFLFSPHELKSHPKKRKCFISFFFFFYIFIAQITAEL